MNGSSEPALCVDEREHYTAIYAKADGETVGEVTYRRERPHPAYPVGYLAVNWLWVHPRFRGRGVGRGLLEQVRLRVREDEQAVFVSVTSLGVKRLVERVFGPLRTWSLAVDGSLEPVDRPSAWAILPYGSPASRRGNIARSAPRVCGYVNPARRPSRPVRRRASLASSSMGQ